MRTQNPCRFANQTNGCRGTYWDQTFYSVKICCIFVYSLPTEFSHESFLAQLAARVRLSYRRGCSSVYPSVTCWYWFKTNVHRIIRFHRRLAHGLVLDQITCCRSQGSNGFRRDLCVKTAKNADFRPINRDNSDTIGDRNIVTVEN